jgi:hypothetical protein
VQPGLDDLAGEAAVLRVYRQAFAVLAREAEKMILTPQLLDVDEAIFTAFAASGSDGLTEEQVRNACRRFPEATVARLLRRIAERGGQSELHELLSLEHRSVSAPAATAEDGRASAGRLTQVFRLIANELSIMSLSADVAQLRENAQLLWGNEALITRAERVHATVLHRWPVLDRECQWLRAGLVAYRDAIDAAAARLIERAGTTRALGLLPAEEWRTFARTAGTEELAAVLDTFAFDAPAPWFDPQAMTEAVESGGQPEVTRTPPPRPAAEGAEAAGPVPDDQAGATVAELLGRSRSADVAALLRAAPDWAGARRILAQLTAADCDPALPYSLTWADGLVVTEEGSPSWVTHGRFERHEDAS